MATARVVWIFRLQRVDCGAALTGLLTSTRVVKAGVNLAEDLRQLQKLFAFEPQNIVDLLSGNHPTAIDAHAVQPHYTRLLAQACGLAVTLRMDGEAVLIVAA